MIKLRQLIVEKTLYHGTTVEKARQIEKHGLIPQAGEFVSSAYDDIAAVEELPELAFAADKKQLQVAVTAATQHIANEMKKDFHDITDQEFAHHAAILKFYDAEDDFEHRPNGDGNYYGEHPSTVEPGDYYTEHVMRPDEILTGNQMLRLLKRHGLWPRGYTFQTETDDQKRNLLIKRYLRSHPDTSKKMTIKWILDMDKRELDRWYNNSRM